MKQYFINEWIKKRYNTAKNGRNVQRTHMVYV